VSYHDELDDFQIKILAELHRRHIKGKKRALALADSQKLRSFLDNEKVRLDAEDLPLSSFLRRVRTNSGVSLQDFASLLDLPVELLEQLETNFSLPWAVAPSSMADIVCLFRLHMTTLQTLTQNSCDVAYFSGHMTDRESAGQSMASWLAQVRSELERRQANDLLD
jgi:transcriptional regulator with XRE-family HTH domain